MTIRYYQEFEEGEGTFYAKENGEKVSHLRVISGDNLFPYIISMNTLEKYRGRGLMENLLKRANNLYWHMNLNKLRTSAYPESEIVGYYERLEEKGLVEKVVDKRKKDFGRWVFK